VLESLITSQTRIRLLLKFFLNSNTSAYLRGLADEFNESTNAIRIELNRMEKAGLITASFAGNKKMFMANTRHPLYLDIHSILLKHTGIDRVITGVIDKLGNVVRAWLTGDMAAGNDRHSIDLVLVGQDIDQDYLKQLTDKAGKLIERSIQVLVISPSEETRYLSNEKHTLLLWGTAPVE